MTFTCSAFSGSFCSGCGSVMTGIVPDGANAVCDRCLDKLKKHMRDLTEAVMEKERRFLYDYMALTRKHGLSINSDRDGELDVYEGASEKSEWPNHFSDDDPEPGSDYREAGHML